MFSTRIIALISILSFQTLARVPNEPQASATGTLYCQFYEKILVDRHGHIKKESVSFCSKNLQELEQQRVAAAQDSSLTLSSKALIGLSLVGGLLFAVKFAFPTTTSESLPRSFDESTVDQWQRSIKKDPRNYNALFKQLRGVTGQAEDRCWCGRVEQRHLFTTRISWSLPSMTAVQRLAAIIGDRSVLEIGAGRGLWAALLRAQGVNIVSTAPVGYIDQTDGFFFLDDMPRLTAEQAINTYPGKQILLIVWPHPADNYSCPASEQFEGDMIIYIGEDEYGDFDGCTDGIQTDIWEAVQKIKIPRWRFTYDQITIFERADLSDGSAESPSDHEDEKSP